MILLVAIVAAITLTHARPSGPEGRRTSRKQVAVRREGPRPHRQDGRGGAGNDPAVPRPAAVRHPVQPGVAGIFINRKNVILLLMCIELMLLAVNFNFIAFSQYLGDLSGPGVRVLHPDGRRRRVRDRPRDPGRAVPRAAQHQRRRPRRDEGLSRGTDSCSPSSLAPLVAAIVAGFFGKRIGRAARTAVTIAGVAMSCALVGQGPAGTCCDGAPVFDGPVYTWLVSDGIRMEVGFLVDRLTRR